MDRDPLRDLLQRADAAVPPPPVPPDLARRVRLRRARRRFRGLAACGAAAVVLIAIGLWQTRPSAPAVPGEPPPAPASGLRAEVERLAAQAEGRLALATRTRELEAQLVRLAKLQSQAREPDPVALVRQERDTAAFILVDSADHLHRDLELTKPAVDLYRETIRVFPQTRWASVAQQRLAELGENGGAS